MANTASVKLTWDEKAISLINDNAVKGLFKMGYDVASMARQRAPYVTGALRSTIRVMPTQDNTVEVIAGGTWGGKKVDYAWIREQGPNRNPATEHYMANSAEIIMSGDYMTKYFGDITK